MQLLKENKAKTKIARLSFAVARFQPIANPPWRRLERIGAQLCAQCAY
jgi:hypothetical protein